MDDTLQRAVARIVAEFGPTQARILNSTEKAMSQDPATLREEAVLMALKGGNICIADDPADIIERASQILLALQDGMSRALIREALTFATNGESFARLLQNAKALEAWSRASDTPDSGPSLTQEG
jgi:hypothetical protein